MLKSGIKSTCQMPKYSQNYWNWRHLWCPVTGAPGCYSYRACVVWRRGRSHCRVTDGSTSCSCCSTTRQSSSHRREPGYRHRTDMRYRGHLENCEYTVCWLNLMIDWLIDWLIDWFIDFMLLSTLMNSYHGGQFHLTSVPGFTSTSLVILHAVNCHLTWFSCEKQLNQS